MKSELHAPSRLIAVIAATATLAGGIVLPATALADDSTAGASQSAQSQTSRGGGRAMLTVRPASFLLIIRR